MLMKDNIEVLSGGIARERNYETSGSTYESGSLSVFGEDSVDIKGKPDASMKVKYNGKPGEYQVEVFDTDSTPNLKVTVGTYGDVTVRNPAKGKDAVVSFEGVLPRGSRGKLRETLKLIKQRQQKIEYFSANSKPDSVFSEFTISTDGVIGDTYTPTFYSCS